MILLSCSKKNKYIPFENIPHTQYLDLKGNICDIQMSFYKEDICEQGYYNPVITNLKGDLFPGAFNPIYMMLFYNVISEYREDVDIFYSPIRAIQRISNGYSSPYIHNIVYTFNKDGYIENFSLHADNKKFAYVNIQYNKKMLINNIEIMQPNPDIYFSIMGKKKFPYEKGSLYLYEYSYFDNDSIFQMKRELKLENNLNIITDNYCYKPKDENAVEVIHSRGKTADSSYIFFDKKQHPIKIVNSKGSALVKNNMIYNSVVDESYSTNTYIKEEFDRERRLVKDQYLWEIKYDSINNRINELRSLSIYDSHGNPMICKVLYTDDERGNWIIMKIIPDRSFFDNLEAKKKRLVCEMREIQEKMTYNSDLIYFSDKLMKEYQDLKRQYENVLNGYYGEYISDTYVRKMSSIFTIKRSISYY